MLDREFWEVECTAEVWELGFGTLIVGLERIGEGRRDGGGRSCRRRQCGGAGEVVGGRHCACPTQRFLHAPCSGNPRNNRGFFFLANLNLVFVEERFWVRSLNLQAIRTSL